MTLYRTLTFPERDRDLHAAHRFVRSAWLSSFKNSDYAGAISTEDWGVVMHAQLGKLLRRPRVRTVLAYDLADEAPSFFYGFVCGDTSGSIPIVHYVYVKAGFRSEDDGGGGRSGPRHARGLLAELGVDPGEPFLYSYRTDVCQRLAEKIPRARFAPAAARYPNYLDHQERQP